MRIELALLSLIAWSQVAEGGDGIGFTRDILPLFQQHCLKCHGGVRRAGGLSLSVMSGAHLTGDSGKAMIVAGQPEQSELFRRVTTTGADERMPAEQPPLNPAQIDTLRRWIEEGAKWPKHWSFASIQTRLPPSVPDRDWRHTAIDSFVLQRLSEKNVSPSPEADRYTLIRRLSLDLLGLPPTPEEADAFAAARVPDSYERLVDRMLASPHFGERWSRHWLDQARYADSDGYEVDKARPDAYRWRDWVIAAINKDMPLDEFTVEQFAGDLLPGATPQQRLATAYHRQTLTNNEGGVDKEEYRFKAVMDRVSNTASVWLGLTLACAQCHDHPYDPFTQREYYSLAAIFNNADETEIDITDAGPQPAKKSKFRVLAEREAPRTTRTLQRGEFLQPGDEVQPGVLTHLHALTPESQNLNRLDLARWLVDPANPLTPRVFANQMWLHLFGHGLAHTPDDFGVRGELPTHPELLDWLAGDLLARGFSRKALIRQIVTSATYRQASRQRPELATADPQNRLLARQNRLRVEAEIVRDLHLSAGGMLAMKIGGPSVFPPLGAEFVKITFRSELPWKASPGEDGYRRGMYTFFKRSVPYPDLMIFDCPDASTAAVQRSASNTPLQALMALNSETCSIAARGLAQRVLVQPFPNDSARAQWLWRICLTRPPASSELARVAELLRTHRRWYETHPDDAKAMAAELSATGASATEPAALIATASVIMNLDEFITRE
jgi:hypothetical protein